MHLDVYEPIWFKLGVMMDNIELYKFDSNLCDLDLDSRLQV